MSAEPRRIVIAIDGPAGAGKSTIAREVARELGYAYVDTGAMYRAVALLAHRRGADPTDHEALTALARAVDFAFPWVDGQLRTIADGEDVSLPIRTPEAAMRASIVSAVPGVRDAMVERQRARARDGGVVMEGRDIGTVVFPAAELKVFLTASARVRGERRWKQLREAGDERTTLESVIEDIQRRDLQDSTRAVAPLRPAEDCVVLDTSQLHIERVKAALLRLARARTGATEEPPGEDPLPA